MSNVSDSFGKEIRKVRKNKNLTLAEMAKKCGCSPSLLSQIETGALNPSLSTLKNICDALDMRISSLISNNNFNNNRTFSLMKEEDRKTIITKGNVKFQLMSKGVNITFEYIRSEWPPGSSSGSEAYTHEGEECALLLEGELEIEVNDTILTMKPGDTITIDSTAPHRVSNPGSKKAVALWVNSVPWVFTTQ